jgi:hypothetical protein
MFSSTVGNKFKDTATCIIMLAITFFKVVTDELRARQWKAHQTLGFQQFLAFSFYPRLEAGRKKKSFSEFSEIKYPEWH